MDFKKDYIKSMLTVRDLPLSPGDCGISDNIKDQWKERSKAYGLFHDKGYVFGSTYHFGFDHRGITDEIMGIIGDPHYSISIDRDYDKISIYMRPMHSTPTVPGDFEMALIKGILLEAKEALSVRPEGTRMQIDIDLPVFIDNDLCRATTIEGLNQQIVLLG